MAEGVLISLATDSVKGLAQLVAARAMNEIHLAWGFKDQLQKLNEKFEYIQAFLEDAGNSKYAHKSRLVNLYVQKVKDAAYLADNVMDEYAIEIFRRKMELKIQWKKKFRKLFTQSNPVFFRLRMAHKVKDILSLFDEIDKVAKDIGLRPVDVATAQAQTDTHNYDGHLGETREYAAASDSEFVGREDDQTKLLDVICSPTNDRHDLSTVAVIGMGGFGKTTLARRLYNSERICAHFSNEKIWVCVAQNFKITRILNEMVESAISGKPEFSNNDTIIRKLEEKVKGKKLLLVLDDVWYDKQDSWDALKDTLHRIGTAPGSVILITTRSDEVADAAGAVVKHKLEGLSNDESWSLLSHKVFHNSSRRIYPALEGVGKRIIEKCKGVPLAIKVIGGLLQSKQHLHEWEKIEKSELWDSPHGHGQDQILPSLLLSFKHLPSASLKQCFAYYAVIPKGRYVYKSELIGLWLSQGYLCNDERTNLAEEEIGEKNLKILLSNSLFEEFEDFAQEIGYKMHDLVYDLAVYVCGSELVKELKNLRETGSCRHLVLNCVEGNPTSDVLPEKALRKLRTLGLNGTDIPWNMLKHTRFLRTLSIDRTGIKELPAAVALLKHLRFLDVSCNPICTLPDSIGKLYQLQTLVLDQTGLKELPEAVALLKHLRFLDVGYNPISTLPDSIGKLYQLQTLILQGCKNMKTLPKVVNKLVNLRYISTTAPMFAYQGLQQLTNLQTLPCLSLDVDGEGWTIDELGHLHGLRDEINILGLECVEDKEIASKAGLAGKPNITKLNLSWMEGRSETSGVIHDEDVLEGLEPHQNITSMKVQNFIGVKFPTWVTEMAVLTVALRGNRTQLNNLTEVKLLNCRKCETLPKLGQLPLLRCLILSGLDVEFIGSEFYGGVDLQEPAVPFKCLRELEISGFRKLVTWMEPPEVAFPCLETLRISDCEQLKAVPTLGIRSLISLRLENLYSVETLDIIKYSSGLTTLIMRWLPEVTSLPQELANCRKLQILEIVGFHKLRSLPRGLESLVNLQSLKVLWCKSLVFIMDDLFNVRSSLHNLEMVCCPSLRKIPSSLEECISLENLAIKKCPLIKFSPISIRKLRRLSDLSISCSSAEHLRSVLEVAQYLPLLYKLMIEGFRDENEMGEYFSDMTPFLRLPYLTRLMLWGHPHIKTLPQQLGLLTQITHLDIWNFDDLEEIPDWICNLSSLVALVLVGCKNLERMPSKENLQRLTQLHIVKCSKLVERCKERGPELYNISDIKRIKIDGEIIQDLSEE